MSEDISGKLFGRLTAIKFKEHKYKGKLEIWECLCECGKIKDVMKGNLKRGLTKSCGCLNKELILKRSIKHGHSTNGTLTRTYQTWKNMKGRCLDPKNNRYHAYGAKNITIEDKRWLDFQNFIDDMGERPPDRTLDRIDNSKGYYKENCRWATIKQQAQNKNFTKNMHSSSKYRGVCWRKDRNKWIVLARFDGKQKKYGSYDNEIDAAKKWDELARLHYGEGNFKPNIES